MSINLENRHIILETERLYLVEAQLEDAAFYFELMNAPGWLQYIGDRGIKTVADAAEYLTHRVLISYQENGFGFYILITKKGEHRIGVSGIIKRPELEYVDVGFAMLPNYERRGYAYEATKAILDYADNILGIYPICAITTPDNIASQKLLIKLGLEERGIHLWEGKEELLLFSNEK